MRSRTCSPSSSFLNLSAGFSGSWWPRAHWPWPRSGSDGISVDPSAGVALALTSAAWQCRARSEVQEQADSAGGTTDRAGYAEQIDVTPADKPRAAAGGRAVHYCLRGARLLALG